MNKRIFVRIISFLFVCTFTIGGVLLSSYFTEMDQLNTDSGFSVSDPIIDYPSTLKIIISIQPDPKVDASFDGIMVIGNETIPLLFNFYGGIYLCTHTIANLTSLTISSNNVSIHGTLLKHYNEKRYMQVAVPITRVMPLFVNLSLSSIAQETFDYSYFLSLQASLKIPISPSSYTGYVNFTCDIYYIIEEWDCNYWNQRNTTIITAQKRFLGTMNDIALYQASMIFENASKCYIEGYDDIAFSLDARFAAKDPQHPPILWIENIVIDLIGNVTFTYASRMALIQK